VRREKSEGYFITIEKEPIITICFADETYLLRMAG
jgi:hypothetical protein